MRKRGRVISCLHELCRNTVALLPFPEIAIDVFDIMAAMLRIRYVHWIQGCVNSHRFCAAQLLQLLLLSLYLLLQQALPSSSLPRDPHVSGVSGHRHNEKSLTAIQGWASTLQRPEASSGWRGCLTMHRPRRLGTPCRTQQQAAPPH